MMKVRNLYLTRWELEVLVVLGQHHGDRGLTPTEIARLCEVPYYAVPSALQHLKRHKLATRGILHLIGAWNITERGTAELASRTQMTMLDGTR